ncbi:MAG: aminotransferase class V-fold PLP-dependent enzyme, partial [Bacteroidetes Order II. Incertae sedis bacterium]|nr:aminotransferase class V-fold PLP-dependent enzyme [Bacteroidetes Order II. bacterium]
SSRSEHKATLDRAITHTAGVNLINPEPDGFITLSSIEDSFIDERFISLMHTNNETGSVNDIKKIAAWAKKKGLLVHCDSVQALKYYDMAFLDTGVDLMSFSGHKIGGPTGIGVLLRASEVTLSPLSVGGGQENGLRPGTENIIGVAGICAALEVVSGNRRESANRIRGLREMLFDGLYSVLDGRVELNGSLDPTVSAPHILNCAFLTHGGQYVENDLLLHEYDRHSISVSTGSACNSGAIEPSHVLTSMGISRERATGSIRFSLGDETTQQDIEVVIQASKASQCLNA